MPALHTTELFEPLTAARWDEARVRTRIREIVGDAEVALRGPRLLWPADPWDRWRATSPMKNLYVGAAGVLWGLDRLRVRGHAETRLDLGALALATLEAFRARPDYMKGVELPAERDSSLACGLAGVAFVAWRLGGRDPSLEDELRALVAANVDNAVDDVMWGAPGTLLLARADDRWRDLRDVTAEALWARRERWPLGGFEPWHGWLGNAYAVAPAVDAERGRALRAETAALLERTAVLESRLQFCAGVPGVVAMTWDHLADDLLLSGAELMWRAGPPGMEKGPCICHGSAGTGHALLRVFARTGDERWLDRARRFAMHALEQVERRGHGRYSLWTGDVGVALFAADCIECRSELPIFDAL